MEEIFGNYRLLDRIAVGGMAEVFRAKRVGAAGFEKTVALKRILPRYATQQEFVQMFTDEANIAAGLQHPNVAQVYDFGQVGGRYYIAMEFVEGWDLQKLLRALAEQDTCCAPDVAARIAIDILRGLGYAHAKCDARGRSLGIVHRDVTPGNMILSTAGVVKIVDFGIVKAKDKISRTRTGVLKGKSRYLAPEGVRGKSIDARSDLYQVGVILYELLTLHRVYDGGSDAEILQAIMRGQTVPVSSWVRVPDPLDRAVMKALEGEPRRRWRTAEEFERALDEFLGLVGGATNDRVVQYARDTLHPQLMTDPVRPKKSGLLQALHEEDRDRISDALESGYSDEPSLPRARLPRRTPLFGHPQTVNSPSVTGSFEAELGEVTRDRAETPEPRRHPPGADPQSSPEWSASDDSQPSLSGLVSPTFQLPVFVDPASSSRPLGTGEMAAVDGSGEREPRELGEETVMEPGPDAEPPRHRTVLGLGDVTAKRDLGELFEAPWKAPLAEPRSDPRPLDDSTRLGAASHALHQDLPSGKEMAQLARAAVAHAASRPAPVLATVTCRRCRRPTPADARFCNACGEPVAAEAPPREPAPRRGSRGESRSGARASVPGPAAPAGSALGGRYEIVQKLGDGPYGTVYLARQLSVKRLVALKVLHPQLSDDTDVARLFSQEVQSAAALRDPHSVVIHDFDRLPDHTLFVAMEYVEGETLSALRTRVGPLELPLALHIAGQILDALAEAHAVGMVHGDVRPENVLICRRGEDAHFVKLTDFGMAALCQGKETLLEVADRPRPLAHLAPEVIAGRSPLRQSDLYAVGVLVWEMLSGLSMPAPMVRKGRLEAATPLRLAPLDRVAPPELIQTLDLVLSIDVARRPPTALRLKESLVRGSGTGSLSLGRAQVMVDPVAAREPTGSAAVPVEERTVGPEPAEAALDTAPPPRRDPDTLTDQLATGTAPAEDSAELPAVVVPSRGRGASSAAPAEPSASDPPVEQGSEPALEPVAALGSEPAVEPMVARGAGKGAASVKSGKGKAPGNLTSAGMVAPPAPKHKRGSGAGAASAGPTPAAKARPKPSRKGPILLVLVLLLGAGGYAGFWVLQIRGIAIPFLTSAPETVTPPAPVPVPGSPTPLSPTLAPPLRPPVSPVPAPVTPPPRPPVAGPAPAPVGPPAPVPPVVAPGVAPAAPSALLVLTLGQAVEAVTWAKGTLVAADRGGLLTRWNVEGDLKPPLGRHNRPVRAVMAQAQGGLLLSAGEGDLVAFDLDGGFERWRRAPGPVVAAALTADGNTLAHADAVGLVHYWSAADGKPVPGLLRNGSPVTALTFLPQGGLITAGADQQLRFWGPAPGVSALKASRIAPHGRILALAVSPDGRWLASGGQDGLVRIFRLPDLAPVVTLTGHQGPVHSLAIIGALVASGGADRLIRLWRIPDGTSLGFLGRHLDRVTSLVFSPRRDSLLSGSADRTVRLWKLGP